MLLIDAEKTNKKKKVKNRITRFICIYKLGKRANEKNKEIT
jgi:hypothetical protein